MCSILLLLPLHTMNVCHNHIGQTVVTISTTVQSVSATAQTGSRPSLTAKDRVQTRSVHVRFCGGRSNFGTVSSPSTSSFRPISFYRRSIRMRPTTSSGTGPQQTTAVFNNTTAPFISSPQCIHTFRMIATINSHYVVMKHYSVLSFINTEQGLAMRSELGFYSNLIIQTANTHCHAGYNPLTSLHSVSRHFR